MSSSIREQLPRGFAQNLGERLPLRVTGGSAACDQQGDAMLSEPAVLWRQICVHPCRDFLVSQSRRYDFDFQFRPHKNFSKCRAKNEGVRAFAGLGRLWPSESRKAEDLVPFRKIRFLFCPPSVGFPKQPVVLADSRSSRHRSACCGHSDDRRTGGNSRAGIHPAPCGCAS